MNVLALNHEVSYQRVDPPLQPATSIARLTAPKTFILAMSRTHFSLRVHSGAYLIDKGCHHVQIV